jgi:proline dehydrogenase
MIRESLLYLSDNPAVRRIVTETPASRRIAERFVAGDTLADAVRCAKQLNASGLLVTLDPLGEQVTDRAEAIHATDVAVQTIEAIATEGIQGNISVKATQLGLELDESLCRDNLRRILDRARELGDAQGEIFVRLDMESSEFTERTISLVEHCFAEGYRNVGTVVQSYLRRAASDVDRLVAIGSRVRLVKGAYREPDQVAFPDKAVVDRKFVEAMMTLLDAGHYPAIATHDEAMIRATRNYAFEYGIARTSFEFQMLYGIRRDLQIRLREEGYNVRVYLPFGDSWYPYLMRRMAERPANLLFVLENVARETPLNGASGAIGLGAGFVVGALAARAWRERETGS